MPEEGNHLPTWTRTVIVHVYHVHIACGYGMLTSFNESETITNFFYIRVYIYSHNESNYSIERQLCKLYIV